MLEETSKENNKVEIEKLPSMIHVKGERTRRPKKYSKKGKDENAKKCHHIFFNEKS